MRILSLTALVAFALAGLAANAGAQTVVTANVTANTTWGGAANPSPIVLQNPIFVTNNATLTILPGTIVRGQPRTGRGACSGGGLLRRGRLLLRPTLSGERRRAPA